MTVKVAINGYGTIGKRVADAIRRQDDMKVIGVTKTRPTFEARMAIEKGYSLYVGVPENLKNFEDAGLEVRGTIGDLLKKSDIVIDCSPSKYGAENKEKYYLPGETKAIYQGGEKATIGEASFSALCNYDQSLGKSHVRVVSCNTTGTSRLLGTLNTSFGIEKVFGTYIRRGADPGQTTKGPINAILPKPVTVPSHHGPDVKTVLDVDIDTIAFVVPTTIMHMHSFIIRLKKKTTEEEVISLLEKTPRVVLVSEAEGITSTAAAIEFARDLNRPRNDIYENCVWRESITLKNGWLFATQAINQESIVVPENIDCVRSMTLTEKDGAKSIRKTDKTLGVKEGW